MKVNHFWAVVLTIGLWLGCAAREEEEEGDALKHIANMFNVQGRMMQLEYAAMAASKFGAPSVALLGKSCCVLVSQKVFPRHNDDSNDNGELVDWESISSFQPLSGSVGCLCVGIKGDVNAQMQILQQEMLNYRSTFASEVPARVLAQRLADRLQGKGQDVRLRPFGAVAILASYEHLSSKSNSDGPTLYRVDPTGHFSRMKATAAGKWETECLEWLEARIGKEEEEEKEDMEDSLFKAVQCLKDGARKAGGAASRETNLEDRLEVAVADKQGFRILKALEVRTILSQMATKIL